ncbi:AzlD family protein [Roseomonas populi]|uniref:AzlD domain-containing protein n=1 Tax=Roseomonas populi TaxID=3121582 RepID=A0ABT1X099_9PROT|nr:AzlD domain-containing protein [Roseomonas pecuniae]MCR0981525.1 AzlD domain-containing protein [Roseomonas pecuniae]
MTPTAMTLRLDVTLAIIAMGLVTYFCRAGGYAILRAMRTPPVVDALLRNLPAPLFAAYVALSLSRQDMAAVLASIPCAAAHMRWGNFGLSIVVGVGAVALLRWAGI